MPTVTFSNTEQEIFDALGSEEFQSGGKWDGIVLTWANRVIKDIAKEIDIRAHLADISLTFTTVDPSLALGDTFFKVSDRFTRARVGENYYPIKNLETLNDQDPDHDETTTAGNPDLVALEGVTAYVWPMFAGTLVIENIYRAPVDMSDNTGNPDLPDDAVVQDLIVAGVCRKGFRRLQDFDLMSTMTAEYFSLLGLYRKHIGKSNSEKVTKIKDF